MPAKLLMIPIEPCFTVTAIALMLMSFTACATSAPSRFYILNSLAGPGRATQAAAAEANITVGIGPVEFPAYLDRQQIVTRVSDNELHLARFDEWAEPLKENFVRVLVEDLAYLLPADSFTVLPLRGLESPDWQMEIEVIRMDGSLGKDVSLLVRWRIFEKETKEMLLTRTSSLKEPAVAPGYEALVAAHNRLTETLSREMADAIALLFLGRGKP